MTSHELKLHLKDLGWSRAKMARHLDVHPNSITRWLDDPKKGVPGPVAAYVRLAVKVRDMADELK